MIQINMGNQLPVYNKESNTTMPLGEIVRKYQTQKWVLPPHQRRFVWDNEKKQQWAERLISSVMPIGAIATYQVTSSGSDTIFINDGSQRIRATIAYIENPQEYGHTKEHAEKVVDSCIMSVQHRLYDNKDIALRDYQYINFGSLLTPYEFYQGVLVYGDESWKDALERLHTVMHKNGGRFARVRNSQGRERWHKHRRDDFALLHRFINIGAVADYRVSSGKKSFDDIKSQGAVEYRLRRVLENMSAQEISQKLDAFERTVERETTLFENVWYSELDNPVASSIGTTVYRWLLHVGIWKRNNNIPVRDWNNFITRFLFISRGVGKVTKLDKDGREEMSTTLQLGGIGTLKQVCTIIDSNLYSLKSRRRKNKITMLAKPGADQSHAFPFRDCGNGEVIPEAASLNRARGPRPKC